MRAPLPFPRSIRPPFGRDGTARPPLWREARVGLEAAALMRDPVFRGDGLRDGRGRPVVLIPGFLAGDGSLGLMSNWLKRAKYRPVRAGMFTNVDCSGAALARLERRLDWAVAEQGSLAGIVTLGSPQVDPFAIHPLVRLQVEAVSRLGSLGAPGLFRRSCLEGECCAEFWEHLAGPMPDGVGFVSIYSRSDGVVDWRACLDPAADEHVEIDASHCGMAVSPPGWRAVAAALARFAREDDTSARAARGGGAKRLRRVA